LENEDGSVSCKPSESMMMGLECKRGSDPLDTLYVCGPAVPEGSDVRFCLPCRVYVASSGINVAATQTLGELWVTYHLWFEKPTEMGTVGAFGPPATISVPLAAAVQSTTPVVATGSSIVPLWASAGGWVNMVNSGDTTGLALAVTTTPAGNVTIPALNLPGVGYQMVFLVKFQGAVTFNADVSTTVSNCTLTKFGIFPFFDSSNYALILQSAVPVNPALPTVFNLAVSETVASGGLTQYTQLLIAPGYQAATPMSLLSKVRAQLASWEKILTEEESLLPREVEERFRRVLAKHEVINPVLGSDEMALKPRVLEPVLRYLVEEPKDVRPTLSQEDFDVVSLEGGGVGLKKSDIRLALERAAWERRLQRGEGLAWRVDGDSKSPAS